MFKQSLESFIAAWIGRSCRASVLVLMVMATPSQAARPEPPALLPKVHLIEDGEFLHPYLPALRTSNDGRVGIIVEEYDIKMFLLTPEKVDAPWHQSTPGTSNILADQTPYLGRIRHRPDGQRGFSHQFLCETTSDFPEADDDANPYACGTDGLNDCYDLTHGGWQSTDGDEPTRLWGTPMTVEVANPKTSDAQIVDVRLGTPVAGPLLPTPVLWEPMSTRDGRLFVGRIGYRTPLTWNNEHAGTTVTDRYDLAYSLLEDDAEDCDVRGWQRIYPIAYAPYDPRMLGKYGIAAFPFRDGQGEPVSETTVFGGTYPWVDRDGDNVFMTTLSTSLGEQANQYPHRCVPGEGCINNDDTSRLKGVSVAGLWTQGRTVHVDNMLNNTDWGLPLDPAGHRMVTLYEQSNGTPVEVRVGAGGRHKDTHYPALKGRTGNTAIIDSVEHIFNHRKEMQPRSPGDVVWLVSNGKATDELVFDDYMNPDGFIVSNMIASVSGRRLLYQDGRYGDVQLQNAAGALPDRWRTPSHGLLREGTGRAEAVALGGIRGRGVWLDGANEVSYDIQSQPSDPKDSDWYVSIFVDSRFANDAVLRNLVRFPDGTALALRGRSDLVFLRDNGNTVSNTVTLPGALPSQAWAHIALQLSDRNRQITVYHNGYAFKTFRIDDGFFDMIPGQLVVGGESGAGNVAGFRGWIDDFKIFAQPLNSEVACNQAGGTLIGIQNNSNWQTVADRYPAEFHDAIGQRVSSSGRGSFDRFACYTDYASVYGIDVKSPPTGTVAVREAINFPEGPVVFNQPRPDSSNNAFCLSCHQPAGKGGLGLDALTLNPNVNAMNDPRRQPLQHLRMVHGNIPEGWLDGRITVASQAGPEGFMLDPYLLDNSINPPDNPAPIALKYTLQNRVWSLLTVPANASAQTIKQLFEDDLPMSSYRQTWIIYRFDPSTQSYVIPSVDSTLAQGDGFWMLQLTGADVTIDLPVDVPEGDSQLSETCASSEGCFSIRVSASPASGTWTLTGAPYSSPVDTAKIRVSSTNGVCTEGCNLEQAKSAGLLLSEQWAFDSTSGQYEAITGTGFLQPWQGFWALVAALPAGTEVTVLFPKPD
ncbi:MAG: LamG-like jellyroll fold domain-containing protein [Granulosicoccus sp.]